MRPDTPIRTVVQCDFDDTIVLQNMNRVVLERFACGDWLSIEDRYAQGGITVEMSNQLQWLLVKGTREEIQEVALNEARVRRGFSRFVENCRERGVRFVPGRSRQPRTQRFYRDQMYFLELVVSATVVPATPGVLGDALAGIARVVRARLAIVALEFVVGRVDAGFCLHVAGVHRARFEIVTQRVLRLEFALARLLVAALDGTEQVVIA